MIGVQKALEPVLVVEYSEDLELLVVEATIGHQNVRIISGYGPQESWPVEERLPFFLALEEEVAKAGLAGKSVMISLDANSKLGENWIPADCHKQLPNGKVLSDILRRHALYVVNSLEGKSRGVITRRRTTIDGEEKSTIDFVILSEDLVEIVESVRRDEEQVNCLTKFSKNKADTKVIKSDHNSIITKFNIKWRRDHRKDKIKLFNLKSVEGQEKFKILTSKPGILSDIFKNGNGDINSLTKKFIKRLNGCLHECFQKIRLSNHENKEVNKLFEQRRSLRTKTDNASKKELMKTEEKLAELCAKENFNKIMDEVKGLESEKGGINAGRLWKIKKETEPKSQRSTHSHDGPNRKSCHLRKLN